MLTFIFEKLNLPQSSVGHDDQIAPLQGFRTHTILMYTTHAGPRVTDTNNTRTFRDHFKAHFYIFSFMRVVDLTHFEWPLWLNRSIF